MFSQFCCSFWLNVRSLRGISWSLYGVNQKKEQMLEFTYLHDVFKIYLQYPFPSTSVQFSSLAQSCPALCDPMNCSTPGLPVHHQFSELTQTHDHWVGDAIHPSHPLSPPSPPALNLSPHQGLFQWVSSLHRVAKVLKLQPQHQSCNEDSGLISLKAHRIIQDNLPHL